MKSKEHYYYRLAHFLEKFPGGRPILVYHKIGFPRLLSSRKGFWISPKLFSRQLAELRAAGFANRELDAEGGGAGVTITFDDGYVSAFSYALETLREHRFLATLFLVTAFLGKASFWDGDAALLVGKAQVREWLQAGHSIGAHTVNHVHLTQVTEAIAREEITASRKFLEDEFGVEVKHFCYPYGDWNRRIAELVAEAGYKTASTTVYGANTGEADLFALKRIHAYVPLRSLSGLYYYLNR